MERNVFHSGTLHYGVSVMSHRHNLHISFVRFTILTVLKLRKVMLEKVTLFCTTFEGADPDQIRRSMVLLPHLIFRGESDSGQMSYVQEVTYLKLCRFSTQIHTTPLCILWPIA